MKYGRTQFELVLCLGNMHSWHWSHNILEGKSCSNKAVINPVVSEKNIPPPIEIETPWIWLDSPAEQVTHNMTWWPPALPQVTQSRPISWTQLVQTAHWLRQGSHSSSANQRCPERFCLSGFKLTRWFIRCTCHSTPASNEKNSRVQNQNGCHCFIVMV